MQAFGFGSLLKMVYLNIPKGAFRFCPVQLSDNLFWCSSESNKILHQFFQWIFMNDFIISCLKGFEVTLKYLGGCSMCRGNQRK